MQNRQRVDAMGVQTKRTTQADINRLQAFRQALYSAGLTVRRDAQFELIDTLMMYGPQPSFPHLSQGTCFERDWHSVYAAVEDGRQDDAWLRQTLAQQQVPGTGIQHFALDGTSWMRPRARTMPDRQYVHQASPAINGGSVGVGYPYSLLDWVPERRSSWSLSVDVRRVPSTQTVQAQGVEQIQQLCRNRAGLAALDIVVADRAYGNHKFLRPLRGERCGLVVRLRKDRVLRRAAPLRGPRAPRRRGRPALHGTRFAFKRPQTWGQPEEVVAFHHPDWGSVQLRRWNALHASDAVDTPFDVVQARVHLERAQPPQPIWLAWQAPASLGQTISTQTIWEAFQFRWPIEPSIRFRKQRLMWTTPQFQDPAIGDRWTTLVCLAAWQLYLARPLAQDCPLPWQHSQSQPALTPARVQRAMPAILAEFRRPTRAPENARLFARMAAW